MNTFISWKKLE